MYRAEYSDGDIEDLDHEQLQRAMEFAIKHVFKDCGSSSEASIDSDSSSDGKSEAAPPKKRKPKNKGGRPKKQKPKPAPPKPPAIASKPARKPACSPGDLRKFKPVIDRKTYEDEKTPPTFHLPRKETRDISPSAFTRLFLPDDVIEDIAKRSEACRQRGAKCQGNEEVFEG